MFKAVLSTVGSLDAKNIRNIIYERSKVDNSSSFFVICVAYIDF